MRLCWLLTIFSVFACGGTAPQKKEATPPIAPPPVVTAEDTPQPVDGVTSDELAPLEPRLVASEQADSLRDEGKTLVKSLALVEGVKKLRESLVFRADQPEVRRMVVGAYMRLGRPMDAMQVTEDWIRISPDNKDAVQLRSQVLMSADRLSDARRLLEKYLDKHADDLEIRNQLARIYVMLGFHGKAIGESATVLKADQVNVVAMTNVARAYLAQNKSELARFVIGQALEVSETPELYHLGARVYIEAENWQQAEAFLRKATELDGDFPEAFNNLGVVYQQVGDYQSAVVALEQAARVAPGYRQAFLNLGNAYRGLKEYTKAQEAYETALTLDNRYAAAYFNLGILFFENQVEGMDDERRLQLVVENFNQYKRVVGSLIPKNDPADRYIEEARRLIEEVRKAKEEELKQPPMDDGLDDGTSTDGTEDGTESPDNPADAAPEAPAETPATPEEPSSTPEPAPVEPPEPSAPEPDTKTEPTPEKNPEPAPNPEPVQPKPSAEPPPESTPEPDADEAPVPEQLPEPDVPEPEPDSDDIPVPDDG